MSDFLSAVRNLRENKTPRRKKTDASKSALRRLFEDVDAQSDGEFTGAIGDGFKASQAYEDLKDTSAVVAIRNESGLSEEDFWPHFESVFNGYRRHLRQMHGANFGKVPASARKPVAKSTATKKAAYSKPASLTSAPAQEKPKDSPAPTPVVVEQPKPEPVLAKPTAEPVKAEEPKTETKKPRIAVPRPGGYETPRMAD